MQYDERPNTRRSELWQRMCKRDAEETAYACYNNAKLLKIVHNFLPYFNVFVYFKRNKISSHIWERIN